MLGIFPQGTSKQLGAPRRYHRGAARLALDDRRAARPGAARRDTRHPRGPGAVPHACTIGEPIAVDADPTPTATMAAARTLTARLEEAIEAVVIESPLAALCLLGWALAAALLLGVSTCVQRRTRDATAVDAGWAGALVADRRASTRFGAGRARAPRARSRRIVGLENLRVASSRARAASARARTRATGSCGQRWRARGSRAAQLLRSSTRRRPLVAAVLSSPDPARRLQPRRRPRCRSSGRVRRSGSSRPRSSASPTGSFSASRPIPRTRARRCATGLWRYSRHPNYFFQWLTWVAYALVALAAPWGWIALTAPAFMLYLILFVTGVPAGEEQARCRARGDDYRRYQRETSAFVPWFRRMRARRSSTA